MEAGRQAGQAGTEAGAGGGGGKGIDGVNIRDGDMREIRRVPEKETSLIIGCSCPKIPQNQITPSDNEQNQRRGGKYHRAKRKKGK